MLIQGFVETWCTDLVLNVSSDLWPYLQCINNCYWIIIHLKLILFELIVVLILYYLLKLLALKRIFTACVAESWYLLRSVSCRVDFDYARDIGIPILVMIVVHWMHSTLSVILVSFLPKLSLILTFWTLTWSDLRHCLFFPIYRRRFLLETRILLALIIV